MNVYCITFPNGKKYIGVETTTGKRKSIHKRATGGQLVHRAINKYGWENCQFDYLYMNITPEEAWNIEINLIKELDLTNREFGYNISTGGRTSAIGVKQTEEHKKRISEALMNHDGYWKGKNRDDKFRNHMSQVMKGREITWKDKLSCKVLCHNNNLIYPSAREAGRVLKLCSSSIIKVCKGKLKHIRGFSFSYVEEKDT